MKMFSDCSGPCCTCSCADCCIAGHGDDNYSPASIEEVKLRLERGEFSSYRDMMLSYVYGSIEVHEPIQTSNQISHTDIGYDVNHIPKMVIISSEDYSKCSADKDTLYLVT